MGRHAKPGRATGRARLLAAAALALAAAVAAPATARADTAMHRLYNPNSGEHFYTASATERDALAGYGWRTEGLAWIAPDTGAPVHRLYNPYAGDHHYTLDTAEKTALVAAGWTYEGVGWYSDAARGVPLFRAYNPNAAAGSHHYTASINEYESIVRAGWRPEGVAWHGVASASHAHVWRDRAEREWHEYPVWVEGDPGRYETRGAWIDVVVGETCETCGQTR
jgi:hypothetical protein